MDKMNTKEDPPTDRYEIVDFISVPLNTNFNDGINTQCHGTEAL